MNVTTQNSYVLAHGGGFTVNIEMPDGSRNFLHSKPTDLESAIIAREIIENQSIDHTNLIIRPDEGYYRIVVVLKINNDPLEFHSRKLNLNDVIYERFQLLAAD